jgi:hypothetical protein
MFCFWKKMISYIIIIFTRKIIIKIKSIIFILWTFIKIFKRFSIYIIINIIINVILININALIYFFILIFICICDIWYIILKYGIIV